MECKIDVDGRNVNKKLIWLLLCMLLWKSHTSSYLSSSVDSLVSGQNLHVKLLLPESRPEYKGYPHSLSSGGNEESLKAETNARTYCIVAHKSSCNIPWSVIARDTPGRGPPPHLLSRHPFCVSGLSLNGRSAAFIPPCEKLCGRVTVGGGGFRRRNICSATKGHFSC